eukprot:CAMPEP_0114494876 /NCGR_PEP_ID=MMETSP0109-20121206/4893_1 /TAXON_ID=29199 /ORGANISM="Chlorarachnion reptans, Strain CCCM449" /LENGTH=193 /DNA_ID=CAMNT_0001671957 /DNA_START=21 /DNA_END=599 /DNA_ORIENTATION=-
MQIIKAHGGNTANAKAWLQDPKNKDKIATMESLSNMDNSSILKNIQATMKDSSSSTTDSKTEKPVTPEAAKTKSSDGLLMYKGKCVKYNRKKGWGFISPAGGGKDVFVHQASIKAKGFRSLMKGEDVEFNVVVKNGRTEAINVTGPGGADVKGIQKDDVDDGVVVAKEIDTKKSVTMFMPRRVMNKSGPKKAW